MVLGNMVEIVDMRAFGVEAFALVPLLDWQLYLKRPEHNHDRRLQGASFALRKLSRISRQLSVFMRVNGRRDLL
jgi:hypothetical protein